MQSPSVREETEDMLGLVYLTWTTPSFQAGILMDVRGNRRSHKLASLPKKFSSNLRSIPYLGDQQYC